MRDFKSVFKKSVKSDKRQTLFVGHPGSDTVRVLPAGQPSPPIKGILKSGHLALKNPNGEKDLYIKDRPEQLEIVEPGAKDDSSLFGRVESSLATLTTNWGTDTLKKARFLSDGFQESVKELKVDAFSLGETIWKISLVLGAVLLIILLLQIFD